MELKGKRVLVTGGTGFLGSYVVPALKAKGAEVLVPQRPKYDLLYEERVERLYLDFGPDVVIHLAATVGGIGYNRAEPGRFFYENMLMGLQMLHYACEFEVEKYVQTGSCCSYPADMRSGSKFSEDDLWDGYPEPTNAPYGVAKRALIVMGDSYRKQYGLRVVTPILANLYGPGDNCDLERSHVVPGMIRRFLDAQQTGAETVTLWGTGKPTREFLYVEDAAAAVVAVTERYDDARPINIGTGHEISIAALAEMVGLAVGWNGTIAFDSSRPDGQMRRRLDTRRAETELGWVAETQLLDGIKKTVAAMRNVQAG